MEMWTRLHVVVFNKVMHTLAELCSFAPSGTDVKRAGVDKALDESAVKPGNRDEEINCFSETV